MKIAAWVVAILLLVAGLALFIEALTTTNSVWLSIPLLALSGGPAIIGFLALWAAPFHQDRPSYFLDLR
jgi:hypothetical protein